VRPPPTIAAVGGGVLDFYDEEQPASALGVELLMTRSWVSASEADEGAVTALFAFPDANWLDLAMAIQLEPALELKFTTTHTVLRQKILTVEVELFTNTQERLVERHVHEVYCDTGTMTVRGGKDAVRIITERWQELLVPIAESVKASAIRYLEG
jgi:hypothetical protein